MTTTNRVQIDPTAIESLSDALSDFVSGDSVMPASVSKAQYVRTDDDGQMWVRIIGNNFETPVDSANVTVESGDIVQVEIANGRASVISNLSSPATTLSYVGSFVGQSIEAISARFSTLYSEFAQFGYLVAEKASIEYLETNYIDAQTIRTTYATVQELHADYLDAAEISARYATIQELHADYLDADTIVAQYATIQNLNAEKARIDELSSHMITVDTLIADKADISDLTAAVGRIQTLESESVTTDFLEANYITSAVIEANYAAIDLANVNNSWINNGVIKNAAISDAQIIGVSANKLTAGEIDASKITVSNLNASNLTVGKINGVRIGVDDINAFIGEDSTLDLDKLSESVPTMEAYLAAIEELQNQIDGTIETWTGSVVPTLNNSPASEWATTELRRKHVGDIYYVVNAGNNTNGYCYRFAEDNGTFSWVLIENTDLTAVLASLMDDQGNIIDVSSFKATTDRFREDTSDQLRILTVSNVDLETLLGGHVTSTTFNDLRTTTDSNSASITTMTSILGDGQGLPAGQTVTQTVNSVKQTTDSNTSAITRLSKTVNGDGTEEGLVQQYSRLDQSLDGLTSTVGTIDSQINNTENGLVTRLATAESNINQMPNEISAAVSESYSKTIINSNSNLEPYFSRLLEDDAYWYGLYNSETVYYTRLGDGWVALDFNRSSATGALYPQFTVALTDVHKIKMRPDSEYTFLVEARNVNVSGGTVYVYPQRVISGDTRVGLFNNAVGFTLSNTYGSDVITKRISATTLADYSNSTVFSFGRAALPAGVSGHIEFRISLYEGKYEGPYKPYASEADVVENYYNKSYIDILSDSIVLSAETVAKNNSQPNLSPFYEADFPTSGTANSYWYLLSQNATQLEDGWAHIEVTSSGSTAYSYFSPVNQPGFKGTNYTALIEIRDFSATGVAGLTSKPVWVYLPPHNDSLSRIPQLCSAVDASSALVPSNLTKNTYSFAKDEFRIRLVPDEAASANNPNQLVRAWFGFNNAVTASFDARISIYEELENDDGDMEVYSGLWKPYVGPAQYGSVAKLELKANKDTLISEINATADVATINASKININGVISAGGIATNEGVAGTYATKATAIASHQVIYHSATSVSDTQTAPTSWITATSDTKTAWTLRRPTRTSEKPVIFTAIQVKTVSGNVSCSTPVVDNSLDDAMSSIEAAAISSSQTIYHASTASTNVPTVPTSWVTSTDNSSTVWTLHRPSYNTNYPVMFVCTQYKTADETIACTTPVLDDTLTVIDGGHITTGTINADLINSGTIDAARLNVSDIIQIGGIATDSSVADTYATKTAASAKSQTIYYQSNSTTAPSAPSSWVTRTTTGNAVWTQVRPAYSASYPYTFRATQTQPVSGSVQTSTVVRDNTLTVISGDSITTGTINADLINSGTLNVDRLEAGSITLTKLAETVTTEDEFNTILRENIVAGGQNLLQDITASSLSKVHAPSARFFGTTTYTGDTAEWVALPSSPLSEYTHGVKHTITAESGSNAMLRVFVFYSTNHLVQLKKGKRYTMDAWYYVSKNNAAEARMDIYGRATGSENSDAYIHNSDNFPLTVGWQRCTTSFECDADYECRAYFRGRSKAVACTVYICGFALYEGGIENIVRETSSGVVVAKQGNNVGALINASGYFDVAAISSWSGNQPTIGQVLQRTSASSTEFFDSNGVSRALFGTSGARIGPTTSKYVQVNADGMLFSNAGTTMASFTPTTITLGATTGKYATLSSTNGLRLYDASSGTAVREAWFSAAETVIGANSSSNIYIKSSNNTIYFRDNGVIQARISPYDTRFGENVATDDDTTSASIQLLNTLKIEANYDTTVTNVTHWNIDFNHIKPVGSMSLYTGKCTASTFDKTRSARISLSTAYDGVNAERRPTIKLLAGPEGTYFSQDTTWLYLYSGVRETSASRSGDPHLSIKIGNRYDDLEDWVAESYYVTSSTDIKYVRKWANGIIEIYRRWTGSRAITTTRGDVYTHTATYNLGCTTYGMTTVMSVEVTCGVVDAGTSATSYAMGANVMNIADDLSAFRTCLWCTESGTKTVWVQHHVIGFGSAGINSI